jgi:hypothetical protein
MLDLTDTENQKKASLDLTDTLPAVPRLPEDYLNSHSWKLNLALGDSSPGTDKIKSLLQSPGGEDSLRQQAVLDETQKRNDAAVSAISDGSPDPNFPVKEVVAQMQQPIDPAAALEKAWGNKVLDTGLAMTNHSAEVDAGYTAPVSAVQKTFADGIAKDTGFQKIAEEANATVASMGWMDSSYLKAVGKSYSNPFYSWYKQTSVAQDQGALKLAEGYSKLEQYQAIRALPPEEALKTARGIYDQIAKDNILEARDWINGLVEYGSPFEETVGAYIDVASLLIPVKAVKGISKSEKFIPDASRVPAFAGPDRIERVLQNLASKQKVLTEEMVVQGRKGNTIKTQMNKAVLDKVTTDYNQLKALAESAKSTPEVQAVLNRIERTTLLAKDHRLEVPEVLSGAGFVDDAAEMQALSWSKPLSGDAGEPAEKGIAQLVARTPSLFNPKEMTVLATDFSKVQAGRLADRLMENAALMRESISGVLPVSRLPTDIEAKALELAKKDINEQFKEVQDAILAVKSIPSSANPLTNTAFTETVFGKPNGSLFKSKEEALNTGRVLYDMQINKGDIYQEGDGYVIRFRKDINETSSDVRDQLITLNNETNLDRNGFGVIPKSLQGVKETFSKFQQQQRGTLTHAQTATQALIRGSAEAISNLNKTEFQSLNKIMKINRDFETIPGKSETRGMFYNNLGELESAYVKHLKRLPSEREAEAYFTFVQLSDLDYIYRSASLYTLKARSGIEKVGFKIGQMDASFEGKLVDNIPFGADDPGSVFYLFEPKSGKGTVKTLKDADYEVLVKTGLKDGSLKAIQTYDPAVAGQQLGTSGGINFIVTPNVSRGAINLSEQLPYRPGFHVKYKDKWFLKQPKIFWDSAKRRVYGGDTSLFGVSNEAKGKKLMGALEDARQAYLAKDDAAMKAAIDKGLPHSLQDLKKMFKTGQYDKDTPFFLTETGQSAADGQVFGSNGKNLEGHTGRFEDYSNSPWNLSQRDRIGYTGEKNSALWSTAEAGTEDNPLFKFSDARTVDPIATQVQALSRLIRSRHFNDYQISAAETFVEEFGVRRGKLSLNGKTLTANELRRNPVYFLHRAEVSGDKLDAAANSARVVQRATQELISHSSPVAESLSTLQAKLLSSIYNKSGDKYIDVVDDLSTGAIRFANNLPSKLRAIAAHTKLFLFNPVQFLMQLQTYGNMVAIAPSHAGSGAMVSMWMRRLDLLPEDADVIEWMSKNSSKITPGWSPEMFKESYKHLKRTGFDLIDGDLSIRNNLADPKVLQGVVGNFLDSAAMIFNGTERFIRLAAWNTAYKEYIEKFPKLVGKLSNDDAKTILNRAQMFSGNMTRDSHAFWQEGYMSGITQFWGYTGRMFDLMTGSQTTKAEKARLLLTWSTLYGVPVAATPFVPIWPWQDQIKKTMLENGVAPDEGVADLITNGLVSTAIEAVSGTEFNVGKRFGPGNIDTLWKLTHMRYGETGLSQMLDIAGGAGGTITGQIISSSFPVISDLVDIIQGDVNESVTTEHLRGLLGNISTFNNADKAWAIYQYGTKTAKNGRAVDNTPDRWEALVHSVTGLKTVQEDTNWIKNQLNKDYSSQRSAISTEAKKYLRLMLNSQKQQDWKAAAEYKLEADALFKAGGFTPDQIKKAIKAVTKEKDYETMTTDQFQKNYGEE